MTLGTFQFSTLVEGSLGIVRWLVGWLVRHYFSRMTPPRILPKLGMKLEGDELGTLAEPDFPGKLLLINYS